MVDEREIRMTFTTAEVVALVRAVEAALSDNWSPASEVPTLKDLRTAFGMLVVDWHLPDWIGRRPTAHNARAAVAEKVQLIDGGGS